jgi:diguanylate cyclase (GGDEF)-like protein
MKRSGNDINLLSQTVRPLYDTFKIIFVYLAMGMLWIFFSDRLLALLIHDIERYQQAQLVKGWIYIFISAAVFFMILYGKLKLIETSAYQIARDNQRLHNLAYFDQLTQLPNRAMLMDQGSKILNEAASAGRAATLCIIDIDNFKHINETLTYSAGDALLCHMASQLDSLRPEQIQSYRVGSDAFAILVAVTQETEQILDLVNNLKRTLEKPWSFMEHQIHTTISIGIATYPEQGDTISDLCQNADTALAHVKGHGKNGVVIFSEDMKEVSWTYLKLFNGLQNAIATDAFCLHYQPIIHINQDRVEHVEALIRWPDTERGFIPPLEFIPFAENTGQIVLITNWVIQEACRFIQTAHEHFRQSLSVTINLSSVDLRHAQFRLMIEQMEQEMACDPRSIMFEITESAAIQDFDQTVPVIRWLRERGYRILLDDFGTGYSSLTYLQKLPIDIIKIDRSFINDISNREDQKLMFRSVIALAHQMGLQVVAEGIETQEQLDTIKESGCDLAQGFLFARPMPADELKNWLGDRP